MRVTSQRNSPIKLDVVGANSGTGAAFLAQMKGA
jgi:hypothetical protein